MWIHKSGKERRIMGKRLKDCLFLPRDKRSCVAQWAPPCPGTYAWNRCSMALTLPVCRKTRVLIVLKEGYILNGVLELWPLWLELACCTSSPGRKQGSAVPHREHSTLHRGTRRPLPNLQQCSPLWPLMLRAFGIWLTRLVFCLWYIN